MVTLNPLITSTQSGPVIVAQGLTQKSTLITTHHWAGRLASWVNRLDRLLPGGHQRMERRNAAIKDFIHETYKNDITKQEINQSIQRQTNPNRPITARQVRDIQVDITQKALAKDGQTLGASALGKACDIMRPDYKKALRLITTTLPRQFGDAGRIHHDTKLTKQVKACKTEIYDATEILKIWRQKHRALADLYIQNNPEAIGKNDLDKARCAAGPPTSKRLAQAAYKVGSTIGENASLLEHLPVRITNKDKVLTRLRTTIVGTTYQLGLLDQYAKAAGTNTTYRNSAL